MLQVCRHVVGQSDGLEPDGFEGRAGVIRHLQPAVVAIHDVLAVQRIDPDRVVVDVSLVRLDARERLAAVDRLLRIHAADVHRVRLVRVDADLAEVHRALVPVRHELPGLALVARPPDAV